MKLQNHYRASLSLAPGCSPVEANREDVSRFNGFPSGVKTAEAVELSELPSFTGLKPGANEKPSTLRPRRETKRATAAERKRPFLVSRAGRLTPASGIYLIECLVYVAVVFLILGLAYALLTTARDYHLGLRRNSEDIIAAMHAGERWREDIRLAIGPVIHSQSTEGPLTRIRQRKGDVYYLYADQSVWRFTSPHGARREVLSHVTHSAMRTEKREYVKCCRWEIEMEPRRKRPGLTPRFFFMAVPQLHQSLAVNSPEIENVPQ